ncbi:ATP-dependent DNA helicase 2 subunit KU80 [Capsicum chinense]|nr:ATP-dependent DNA helicase 2 subunit KU80 [Capsicum chinense]
MKNRIFDLVENSYEGDTFHKALECLVALRKGCILEQEPKKFNDFLCHLSKFCQEDVRSFCQYLTSHEITLITKAEAPDSEIPKHKARSFMVNPALDLQNKQKMKHRDRHFHQEMPLCKL